MNIHEYDGLCKDSSWTFQAPINVHGNRRKRNKRVFKSYTMTNYQWIFCRILRPVCPLMTLLLLLLHCCCFAIASAVTLSCISRISPKSPQLNAYIYSSASLLSQFRSLSSSFGSIIRISKYYAIDEPTISSAPANGIFANDLQKKEKKNTAY